MAIDLKSKRLVDKEGTRELLPRGLYVVATPIGNARDITLRALDVLGAAAVIACEDTRVTAKLLAIYGIARPLRRYDEHTATTSGPRLLDQIKQGDAVALVSDAGTPLISDPGLRLVRSCIEADLPVVPIPGPSAVLTALSVAGLPAERFLFAGFLPSRSAARRRTLNDFLTLPATLVFLESPHRLAASLADMALVLGPRQAAVGRELTKHFEETRRGSLSDLAQGYAASPTPKGECTVVVAPPEPIQSPPPDIDDIDDLLKAALEDQSARDAAASVAAATGLPRRTVYARAMQLKRSRGEEPL